MSTIWGHQDRFDLVADTKMPVTTDTILWYAFGMAGRLLDLPPNYLEAVATSVTKAHPRSLSRRALLYAVVSGRFRRSTHPQLRGLDPAGARAYSRTYERRARQTGRPHGVRQSLAPRKTRDTIDD